MACPLQLANYLCILLVLGKKHLQLTDDFPLKIDSSIRPESTIPICLDLGTNTQRYLEDPLYLGLRQKRVSDQEMTEFMDEFMHEMTTTFPKLMIQFEVF